MKKTVLALACLLFCGVAAAAGPPTFVEGALIDGGENGRNGSSDQFGLEAAGDAGLTENWYVGGILGTFRRDGTGGDIDNTYLNGHVGYLFPVNEKSSLTLEGGLWIGDQDNPGNADTDPWALEFKMGMNHALSEKFSLFGTLAVVNGDLDTPGNSDLRNYIWSLGGSYACSKLFSLNLRILNGYNGVNGQDQVLRFAGRWTFGHGGD